MAAPTRPSQTVTASGIGIPTRRQIAFNLAAFGAALLIGSANGDAAPTATDTATAARLVSAAEAQVGITTIYDAAYVRLGFPGGDVPADRGVCTDVIVRAYRAAFSIDLQAKLNADMRGAFAAYPRRWGLTQTDANIDHRRVPNLQVYFARQGAERPRPTVASDWLPGDLVTQMIPGGRPHIGIVSGRWTDDKARPLIIHNIGRGTQIEDVLDLFAITGRYRLLPPA
jgi:uncharacterized protein